MRIASVVVALALGVLAFLWRNEPWIKDTLPGWALAVFMTEALVWGAGVTAQTWLARFRHTRVESTPAPVESVAKPKTASSPEAYRLDRRIIFGILITVASTIAPWGIGFVLQDSPLLPRGAGVFDAAGRNYLTYFLPFLLTGAAVLLVALSIALLTRSWRGRKFGVSVGGAALAFALPLAAVGNQQWVEQEMATAVALRQTAPTNLSCEYFSCSAHLTGANGAQSLWTLDAGESVGVYDGWRKTGVIEGDYELANLVVGESVASSAVWVQRSDGSIQSWGLDPVVPQWTSPANYANLTTGFLREGDVVITGNPGSGAIGISAASGAMLWVSHCPATFGNASSPITGDFGLDILYNGPGDADNQIALQCTYAMGFLDGLPFSFVVDAYGSVSVLTK